MDKSQSDISNNIGESDEVLDPIIQDYLDGRYYPGPELTVAQWRLENSDLLRQWLFKTQDSELSDATGKINDPDNDVDIIAEGQEQLVNYATWRKAVKARFLKE